jgi:4-hydroxy-4-methyl-2-oxoglutarate aldolase
MDPFMTPYGTSGDSPLVQAFSELAVSAVAAALDELQIAGRFVGLKSLGGSSARLCGRAFTVQFLPCAGAQDGRTPNGTLGEFLPDVPPGYVLVLDNRGDASAAVWTADLARAAAAAGVAGTVIDGACEDLSGLPHPVYARGTQTTTARDRVRAEAFNVPVAIGPLRVECDDLVMAGSDTEGLVVVPRDHLQQVLAAARRIAEAGVRS